MQSTICPTVTASDPDDFRRQMERIAKFAVRVHVDLSDGKFTPTRLVDVSDVWWPGGMRADLHVMMQNPFEHNEAYLALAPQLVIVHAEGKGDFIGFSELMHKHGIEVGVGLLQETPVDLIVPALDIIDHVMIFSGSLGRFGGKVDLQLLEKVHRLKQLKPSLEIGWDGGVSDQNARTLAEGGVDVLNVGGFIQRSSDPIASYNGLKYLIGAAKRIEIR